VRFHGPDREHELRRDLGVRPPGRRERGDLALAPGELCVLVPRRAERGGRGALAAGELPFAQAGGAERR
jgi:hypothetical protein